MRFAIVATTCACILLRHAPSWCIFLIQEQTKRGRAYSLVCGILAVGNRNQTFLQFTTNHLDEERNMKEKRKKKKKKSKEKGSCRGVLSLWGISRVELTWTRRQSIAKSWRNGDSEDKGGFFFSGSPTTTECWSMMAVKTLVGTLRRNTQIVSCCEWTRWRRESTNQLLHGKGQKKDEKQFRGKITRKSERNLGGSIWS